MKRVYWNISAGAIVLFALMYFFDGIGLVSAMLPAVLMHELGHVLSLRISGSRLTRISVTLTGIEMDYAPQIEGLRAVLCCLSGPLTGAIYALTACTIGGAFGQMSGTISFLLSAFNLLPILPLDGGRITAALLPIRSARITSTLGAFLLLLGGAFLAARFSSFCLLLIGAWLTVCNLSGLAAQRINK